MRNDSLDIYIYILVNIKKNIIKYINMEIYKEK